MQLKDAIQLLQPAQPQLKNRNRWADLGCGNGLFTKALAHLIDPGGIIYCVDTNQSSFNEIPDQYNEQVIEKVQADFVKDDLPVENLTGILMANSLHYVKDKATFFKKLNKYLQKDHYFIIVEYDTSVANRWVPYPLNFQSLLNLFMATDKYSVTKLNEHLSIYNNGKMYAALIDCVTK
ncbi:methyltransferase domain-containing protein [Terrimonas pollutisoli]|uniref:methyltransferase domain-containing protein n=1 Tax=Terrimonas pollutisoli TaxID=3034147 RepID=UPI0023ED62EE|nr:methyltransferase domain-containing protein [Terrimonas sp. H1YJ31]